MRSVDEAGWEKLLEKTYTLPANLNMEFISGKTDNKYSAEIKSEAEAIQFCTDREALVWFDLTPSMVIPTRSLMSKLTG